MILKFYETECILHQMCYICHTKFKIYSLYAVFHLLKENKNLFTYAFYLSTLAKSTLFVILDMPLGIFLALLFKYHDVVFFNVSYNKFDAFSKLK